MRDFNYSRFHYFDKDGHEIMLNYKSNAKITVLNETYPGFESEYAYVRGVPEGSSYAYSSSLLKLKSGMRYNLDDDTKEITAHVVVNDTSSGSQYESDKKISNTSQYEVYKLVNQQSNVDNENYVELSYNNVEISSREKLLDNLGITDKLDFFPTLTFSGNLNFERVSTGLVETQTIYVLVEDLENPNNDGTTNYVTVKEYCNRSKDYEEQYDAIDGELLQILENISDISTKIDDLSPFVDDHETTIHNAESRLEAKTQELHNIEDELHSKYIVYGKTNPELEAEKQAKINEIQHLKSQIHELYSDQTYVENRKKLDEYELILKSYNSDAEKLSEEYNELEEKIALCEDISEYINRFKLLFFIDCREQEDFRMFHVKYDEMSWSDRTYLDFNKIPEDGNNDNGYSVNIGFSGQNEGVYEHKLYVCLLDTSKATSDYPGEVYPIGELNMSAETEGEDERYRTFFTNFGIPDPKYYDDIFNDSELNDDLPNYSSINKHSKKMFLAYSEIFPYIGSYKALLNAVRLLGYEDEIFFKEWYKEIGNNSLDDSGYTSYEISGGSTINKNTTSNLSVEERIHLKKMNWISMVYRLNEEIDKAEDKFGFPTVITKVKNFNTDKLAKLQSLKKWLEQYAIGVNCHITDISGEGLVFERYALNKFGTYQRVLDYKNEKSVSAVIENTAVVIKDNKADINVDVYTSDQNTTIEEIGNYRFLDYCNGYFDENKVYHDKTETIEDSSLYIYFSTCFSLHDSINTFEIRTKGTHDSFRFGKNLISSFSPDLILDENGIMFDPIQCVNHFKNTSFTTLPIIQIEEGEIKRYIRKKENIGEIAFDASITSYLNSDGVKEYNLNVNKTGHKLSQIPTLIPPTYANSYSESTIYPSHQRMNLSGELFGDKQTSIRRDKFTPVTDTRSSVKYETNRETCGLRFTTDNVYGIPRWMIIGYEEKHLMLDSPDSRFVFPAIEAKDGLDSVDGYEYMMDITKGRMIFNDSSDNTIIILNFDYDGSTNDRKIYVQTFKESQITSMHKYKISSDEYTNRFLPSNRYDYFTEGYNTEVEDYVDYENRKSIEVKYAGEYDVDALLYDEFNNIFVNRSAEKVHVLTPFTDASVYICENAFSPSDLAPVVSGKSSDMQVFHNIIWRTPECIFGYVPKLPISSVYKTSIQYTGLPTYINKKYNTGKASITSLSDRFDVIGRISFEDYYVFILSKRSAYNSHRFLRSSDYFVTTDNIYTDLESYLNKSKTEGNSYADVMFFIYDDLYEFPVASYNGVMLPLEKYRDTSCDEYYFVPYAEGASEEIEEILKDDNDEESIYSKKRYSYYVIPQWLVDCSINYINPSSGEVSTTLNYNQPFGNIFKVNDPALMVYHTNKFPTNYGHGTYTVKSSNYSDLRLSTNKRGNRINHGNLSNFDGSTYIGRSSIDYIKYMINLDQDKNDVNSRLAVAVDDNDYKHCKSFLTKEYAISFRDFDPEDAIELWEFSKTRYDTASSIRAHWAYKCPVVTAESYVELSPLVSGLLEDISYVYTSDITVRWRIYRNIGGTSRKMIIESYNKVLMLKLKEYGLYDVEMTIWDECGNKHERKLDGLIKYVKSY